MKMRIFILLSVFAFAVSLTACNQENHHRHHDGNRDVQVELDGGEKKIHVEAPGVDVNVDSEKGVDIKTPEKEIHIEKQ